jgi:hypothetical protein
MRAFVLLALLALASASAPTGGSGYDECPAAPARPGDRRKGDPRTFTLAVQRVSASSGGEKAGDGSSDVTRLELVRSRLERVAAEITALDADFVHVTGVGGCAALNARVAASTAIDARVAGDYRPYLVAPETAPHQLIFPATAAMLTRVDPTANVYVAPDSVRGGGRNSAGEEVPPSFPHYFARTRLGRVDVVVAGVAEAPTSAEGDFLRESGSDESWAAEALATLGRGEELIVVGTDASFLKKHPRVFSFLRTNAFLELPPGAVDTATVWVSPRVAAATRRGKEKRASEEPSPSPLGYEVLFDFARLEFEPGAFTNEAETIAQYLTKKRVFLTACEVAFAAVFFPGVVTLAFQQPRGAAGNEKKKKTR